MSVYRNNVAMSVSGTPGTGTITLGSAVTGAQSFAAAYGANATVDVFITDGNAWEVARDCTYTHSGTTLTRGTLEASSTGAVLSLTSAAVVRVAASAATVQSLAFDQVAGPNAATTMEVGKRYAVDLSTFSADRTYTLPATCAVGDRIQVVVTVGSSTRAVILQANTGDSLNGVVAAEWSRLFITGEVVTMVCTAGNSAWAVEVDGRIPQVGRMGLTADITTSSAGAWTATRFNEALIAVGCVVSATGSATATITVRRAGRYIVSGAALSKAGATLTDQEQHGWACTANGNVGTGTIVAVFSANRASGTAQQGSTGVIAATCSAGDVLQHNFIWATADAGLRGLNYASFLSVAEVL